MQRCYVRLRLRELRSELRDRSLQLLDLHLVRIDLRLVRLLVAQRGVDRSLVQAQQERSAYQPDPQEPDQPVVRPAAGGVAASASTQEGLERHGSLPFAPPGAARAAGRAGHAADATAPAG